MKRAVIMADGKMVDRRGPRPRRGGRGRAAGQPQVGARAGRPPRDPPGAGAGRQQYLERRQAARDQPADALRSAEAIRAAAMRAWRLLAPAPAAGGGGLLECAAGRNRRRIITGAGSRRCSQGQPRVARIELLNAIAAAPNDGRIRIAAAETDLRLGDGVAAEAELRRARALGIGADATRHLMAHAFLLQHRPDQADRRGGAGAGALCRLCRAHPRPRGDGARRHRPGDGGVQLARCGRRRRTAPSGPRSRASAAPPASWPARSRPPTRRWRSTRRMPRRWS